MTCDSDTGEAYSDYQHYIAEANKSCIRQNLPLNIISQPFKFLQDRFNLRLNASYCQEYYLSMNIFKSHGSISIMNKDSFTFRTYQNYIWDIKILHSLRVYYCYINSYTPCIDAISLISNSLHYGTTIIKDKYLRRLHGFD